MSDHGTREPNPEDGEVTNEIYWEDEDGNYHRFFLHVPKDIDDDIRDSAGSDWEYVDDQFSIFYIFDYTIMFDRNGTNWVIYSSTSIRFKSH